LEVIKISFTTNSVVKGDDDVGDPTTPSQNALPSILRIACDPTAAKRACYFLLLLRPMSKRTRSRQHGYAEDPAKYFPNIPILIPKLAFKLYLGE
jgi:hypothetical protein